MFFSKNLYGSNKKSNQNLKEGVNKKIKHISLGQVRKVLTAMVFMVFSGHSKIGALFIIHASIDSEWSKTTKCFFY